MRKGLLVTLVCLLLALAGCSDSEPGSPRTTAPRAIGDLDPASMSLVRVEFCDLVPAGAVQAALGAVPAGDTSWRNGDPVPGGSADEIGREFGCGWSAAAGSTARAWVFARPVTPPFARTLVRSAAKTDGCRSARSAFGRPAVLETCSRANNKQLARHSGLFGDTWLTCEVTQPGTRKAATARANAWCLAVAGALDTNS